MKHSCGLFKNGNFLLPFPPMSILKAPEKASHWSAIIRTLLRDPGALFTTRDDGWPLLQGITWLSLPVAPKYRFIFVGISLFRSLVIGSGGGYPTIMKSPRRLLALCYNNKNSARCVVQYSYYRRQKTWTLSQCKDRPLSEIWIIKSGL